MVVICRKCGSDEHATEDCSPEKVECSKCGGLGHNAKDCEHVNAPPNLPGQRRLPPRRQEDAPADQPWQPRRVEQGAGVAGRGTGPAWGRAPDLEVLEEPKPRSYGLLPLIECEGEWHYLAQVSFAASHFLDFKVDPLRGKEVDSDTTPFATAAREAWEESGGVLDLRGAPAECQALEPNLPLPPPRPDDLSQGARPRSKPTVFGVRLELCGSDA
eukprot:gene8850-8023_t